VQGPDFNDRKAPEATYGAWSNSESVRQTSTSGGIAFELASAVLEEGGVVVGCVMRDDHLPYHRIIDSMEELQKTKGSKYLPSNLEGVYKRAALETSRRRVLFIGTPCQVRAFETYVKPANRDRVLTADVICFGLPSVLPWKSHVAELFGDDLKLVNFRDKSTGWSHSSVKYAMKDGTVIHQKSNEDVFLDGFHTAAFHQLICHSCPFAKIPRVGDVTLGDFWGVPPEWKDERGVSLVVASTKRGLLAINDLRERGQITLFNTTLQVAAAANPRLLSNHPIEHPHPRRAEVLRRLAKGEPLCSVASLYQPCLAVRLLKRVLPSTARMFIKNVVRTIKTKTFRAIIERGT
jgi:coenzyme F420-reducing hydrogenase beta subunit